ncbi:MAG TPA: hypothetical protein VLA95_06665 [Gemmatimonadales bacterium]|nr:hypothetical protein [Gemmatimonadales bacterium]
MSFALYVAGFLVLIAGVAWGMVTLGMPTTWVLIASVILLGIGILTGVARTRSRDLPKDPSA